eukprot:CAMPEP_0176475512 /NCGR_PEP_ID=MMETSP0127-20121128/43646_1 /TAXON_ID=938130 /ORGANISM="Platyophrya macrostoma, Strain WH" /LENGTH=159 /DNA_ID=CAMNT_0017871113 /DNA_START=1 /DNA_END=477 /DNA_ORIENTATION=-
MAPAGGVNYMASMPQLVAAPGFQTLGAPQQVFMGPGGIQMVPAHPTCCAMQGALQGPKPAQTQMFLNYGGQPIAAIQQAARVPGPFATAMTLEEYARLTQGVSAAQQQSAFATASQFASTPAARGKQSSASPNVQVQGQTQTQLATFATVGAAPASSIW